MPSTSVRIDLETHRELKVLADALHLTVGETVRFAITRLRQARIATELETPLTPDEKAWLDADFG